ncbi:MAG: OprD family outer membrane porin [Candidatus Thiodiazotropha sp.]|nr:OprD family outer membrane porin [Candidatus Thiodiazotropha sp.]MCM8884470.1 OprD family outer membrane porin [Candidatus Thiodiazotropha sp.]MCM8921781.1 OprD family outer membrane porin [Candidatus Thiodiazotropha sp.]
MSYLQIEHIVDGWGGVIFVARIKIQHYLVAVILQSTIIYSPPGYAEKVEESGISGNIRIGFIDAEDKLAEHTKGSAIGGKVGFVSQRWYGLSGGATIYTSQKLFNNENGDFFASDHSSYSIFGEVFLQGSYSNTQLVLGRFELDTPHADTDDIRMIPNTFQGGLLSNSDLPDTTLYLTYLDEWAGFDAGTPEKFKDMNGENGIAALGVVYTGFENLDLQGWLYQGKSYAQLFYLEGMYETDRYSFSLQYGTQSDKTQDGSGPDGNVYGVATSYITNGFTLLMAYNDVSGTVTDGFGGGPYFTSADDHTIGDIEDQSAAALGLEYNSIPGLVLGVLHVDFNVGSHDTDYYVNYYVNESLDFELIYTDMHEDGHFVRLMGNYLF